MIYEFWSIRMRSLLQEQECWDPVDLGYLELDPIALATMTNRERVAQEEQRKRENTTKFWI